VIPGPWREMILDAARPRPIGRVCRMVGLHLEVEGVDAAIGEGLYVQLDDRKVSAEVVAIRDGRLICMPYGDLEGVRFGSVAVPMRRPPRLAVGPALLGRVIDAEGVPLDGRGPIEAESFVIATQLAPPPMSRPLIDSALSLGTSVLDTMVPCGKGQRLGIFAGAGVGKSSLLSMIIRGTEADVKVLALVGERGREVREFIENDLSAMGLTSAVVVVATSDQPALLRIRAALVATRIAEYFRDLGNDVLLIMDSLTRLAMAQREVGLSSGEPPSQRGYPPSVNSLMARLLERAGRNESGSITALYSILVDGDDLMDPVADAARSILDGHITLSRERAQMAKFPAVEVLESISRLESSILSDSQMALVREARSHLATYAASKDLVEVGAYRPGTNLRLDRALSIIPRIEEVFCQDVKVTVTAAESWRRLEEALHGGQSGV